MLKLPSPLGEGLGKGASNNKQQTTTNNKQQTTNNKQQTLFVSRVAKSASRADLLHLVSQKQHCLPSA
jgi:hypothetical protein